MNGWFPQDLNQENTAWHTKFLGYVVDSWFYYQRQNKIEV